MHYYTPQQVPILSRLALEFAVSDRWFASAPCETWPNRFFLHTGTAKDAANPSAPGYEDNRYEYSAATLLDNDWWCWLCVWVGLFRPYLVPATLAFSAPAFSPAWIKRASRAPGSSTTPTSCRPRPYVTWYRRWPASPTFGPASASCISTSS